MQYHYVLLVRYIPLCIVPLIIYIFSNHSFGGKNNNARTYKSVSIISVINQEDRVIGKIEGKNRILAEKYKKKCKHKNIRSIEHVEKNFSEACLITDENLWKDYHYNPVSLVTYLTENLLVLGEEKLTGEVGTVYAEVINSLYQIKKITQSYNEIATITKVRINSLFESLSPELLQRLANVTDHFAIRRFVDIKDVTNYLNTIEMDPFIGNQILINMELGPIVQWFQCALSDIDSLQRVLSNLLRVSDFYKNKMVELFPLCYCHAPTRLLNQNDQVILETILLTFDNIFYLSSLLCIHNKIRIRMQQLESFEQKLRNLTQELNDLLHQRISELLKRLGRVTKKECMGIICVFKDIMDVAEYKNEFHRRELLDILGATIVELFCAKMEHVSEVEKTLISKSVNFLKIFVKKELYYDLETDEMKYWRKKLNESDQYKTILKLVGDIANLLFQKRETEYLLSCVMKFKKKIKKKNSYTLRNNDIQRVIVNSISTDQYYKLKAEVENFKFKISRDRKNRISKEYVANESERGYFLKDYLDVYKKMIDFFVVHVHRWRPNLHNQDQNRSQWILLILLFLIRRTSINLNL